MLSRLLTVLVCFNTAENLVYHRGVSFHVKAAAFVPLAPTNGVRAQLRSTRPPAPSPSPAVISLVRMLKVTPNHEWDDNQSSCADPETSDTPEDGHENEETIRVRIWRALAMGDELSMKQLASAVASDAGDGAVSVRKDLKHHLQHVAKQAETLPNKSEEWRQRRGLSPMTTTTDKSENDNPKQVKIQAKKKLQLKTRRGKRNEFFVRLA